MFLWVEPCCSIVYILNRCFLRVLKDKTPKEAFIGEKHNVSHFRVFGSLVCSHVPKKRVKLEPSSLKDILVGYSESSKAHKIYVPSQRKIVVS
jgi:predicted nucleotidyltransferase